MFGLFRRGSDGNGAKPSLDDVRFDARGYTPQGEPHPGKVRVWHTPEGDGLGVYYFPVSPDLPSTASSVDDLAAFYVQLLGESGGKLVDVNVTIAGGCPAVCTILSVPQQPSGRTYVGSLTVPFRDFSFVIKCQCAEGGTTGLKEALLFDRSQAANVPMQIDVGQFHIPSWDPDAEKYDAEFPAHPVARARRVLAHVIGSLVVAAEVKKLPGFALPQ